MFGRVLFKAIAWGECRVRSIRSTESPDDLADLRYGTYDSFMTPAKSYPNAPITEAIIDLRVKSRADLEAIELDGVRQGEETQYPHSTPIYQAEGTITISGDAPPTASAQQQLWGYKFTSASEKSIWQSRRDGFTFSQLAPYTSWEPFRDAARRLWRLFRERTQPIAIERLAVRYVNRIDIPFSSVDLKEFFRTSPEISPDLPQELSSYFMQLCLPQLDLNGQVLINQTIIPPPSEGVVSVVLDIDLYSDRNVPDSEESVWEFFEKLHVRKNEIFEACITDKTRRLFESCR